MGDQSLSRSGPVPEAICPAARPSATTRVARACWGRQAPGLTKLPAVVAAPRVSAEARPLASPGGARRARGFLNWAPRGRGERAIGLVACVAPQQRAGRCGTLLSPGLAASRWAARGVLPWPGGWREVWAPHPSVAGPPGAGRRDWREARRPSPGVPASPTPAGAEPGQPRGCSDTQRPSREVRAPQPGLPGLGLSRFPPRLRAGTPEESSRALQMPAGHFPCPSPISSPQAPERREILRHGSARKGGAGCSSGAGL
nr:translation initiation factor IF-2-like [Macaca fascicularis]